MQQIRGFGAASIAPWTRPPRPDRRTAFKSGHCGAGPGRHRCARLCLVERGWAAAVRAAIGRDRAEKRAARSSAAGDRAATGRVRRADERRQGLTETQHQAAHTIAAMKAAEEDLRRHVPPPYWYSNPATLDLAIAKQPQWAGVAPPPRRPATARSESRGLRKREGAAPASPASPQ